MRVHEGYSRTAYVGRRFTFKVANFSPANCARTIKSETKKYFTKTVEYELKELGLKHYLGQVYHFFHGTMLEGAFSNLWEFYGSLKFRDIVVPTRFSLFGIINIMDTAQEIGDFSEEETDAIINCFDHKDIKYIEHTVIMARNYGVHKGKLKLLDCGSRVTIKALSVQRDEFRKVLDTIEQIRGLANIQ